MELVLGGSNFRVIKVDGFEEAYFYSKGWRRWGTGELANLSLQDSLTKLHDTHIREAKAEQTTMPSW